jgi:SAM-dependent methyltransferase
MTYDLVFDRVSSIGIGGVVRRAAAVTDAVISAHATDAAGNETLLATSSLALWRPEARQKFPGVVQPYCGFNLPFRWTGPGSLPRSAVVRIGDQVVGRFDDLSDPVNSYGLTASDVLSMSDRSFFGLQGISLQNGLLSIAGVLTPPKGDVNGIEFVCPPGVVAKLVWPIYSDGSEKYYWYVPGVPYLGFRIDVALADCRHPTENHIEFGLHVKGEGSDYNSLRNVTLPLSFEASMNFPPEHNVQRVQRVQNRNGASVSGASDAHRILKIAARHTSLDRAVRILDWGCGFGRVSRHLHRFAPAAEVLGADIDAENLTWMAANEPHVKPVTSDISGHIDLPDESVDIVFGISVMTHLRVDVMKIWLKELCRIVKGDGLLLLTVAGAGSLAFTSSWIKPEQYAEWRREGRIVFDNNGAVDSDIGGENYYVQSKINEASLREIWSEFVDVVDFIPTVFGYQDLVVCRPRTRNAARRRVGTATRR